MGGFVFETTPSKGREEFVVDSPKLVLTRIGLNYMIEQELGVLPALEVEDIKDLGKADSLAKGLVCFQATFIVVQNIARCVRGLPVAFLEINTMGHAVCALLMYRFWFRKPKDVKTQAIIRFDGAEEFAAFLYFGGSFDASICPGAPDLGQFLHGRHSEDSSRSIYTPEIPHHAVNLEAGQRDRTLIEVLRFADIIKRINRLNEHPRRPQEKQPRDNARHGSMKDLLRAADPLRRREWTCLLDPDKMQRRCERQIDPEYYLASSGSAETNHHRSLPRKLVECFKHLQLTFQRAIEGPAYDWYGDRGTAYNFDSVAIVRLSRAADFIESRLDGLEEVDTCVKEALEVLNGVVLEAPNWPTQVGCRGWSIIPQLGMAFVTICYGGFHALALIEEFPTGLERHLWMASCICLACSGAIVSAYALARETLREKTEGQAQSDTFGKAARHDQKWHLRFYSWMLDFVVTTLENSGRHFFFVRRVGAEWKTHFILAAVLRIAVWLGALAAVASRVFIVVEAFISLRSMPPKMYETPDWPNWIPHL